MKKIITIVFVFVILNISFIYANKYDISQIQNCKMISDYSSQTNIDSVDTIVFGSYPQSSSSENNQEPIEWVVVKKENNKFLLLSKYILDYRWYHNDTSETVTWENAKLREYLNKTFYSKAFNKVERKHVLNEFMYTRKRNEKGNNIEYQITTTDRVAMLDEETIIEIFGNNVYYLGPGNSSDNENKLLVGTPTYYAKNKKYEGKTKSKDNSERSKLYLGNHENCAYWLRTGNNVNRFGTVNINEHMKYSGPGIRPTIWVSISEINEANNDIYIDYENMSIEEACKVTKIKEGSSEHTLDQIFIRGLMWVSEKELGIDLSKCADAKDYSVVSEWKGIFYTAGKLNEIDILEYKIEDIDYKLKTIWIDSNYWKEHDFPADSIERILGTPRTIFN